MFFRLRAKELLQVHIAGHIVDNLHCYSTAKSTTVCREHQQRLYSLFRHSFLKGGVTGSRTHCPAPTYLCWGFAVLGCNLFDLGVIQKARLLWLSPTETKKEEMAKNFQGKILPSMNMFF